MIRRYLYNRTATMPCRLISRDGKPYLERYFVRELPGGGVAYLHRFVAGDGDPSPHDHPRNALSICLVGRYREDVVVALSPNRGWITRERTISRFRPRILRASTFHRIKAVEPDTWTLFLFGPSVKSTGAAFAAHGHLKGWGFLYFTPGAWIQHRPGEAPQRINGTVAYRQHLDITDEKKWWLDAPLGRDSGREPLKED